MRGAVPLCVALLLAGCTFDTADPPPATTPPPETPSVPPPSAPTSDPVRPSPTPVSPTAPPPASGEAPPQPPSPDPVPPSDAPVAPSPNAPAPTAPTPVPGGGDPVAFLLEPGRDAPGGPYFRSWTRAADGRSFHANLTGVPGARLDIDSLARVTASSRDVKLVIASGNVTDPAVLDARLRLMESGVERGSLDMRAASPRLEILLSQGVTYDIAWTWTLAEDGAASASLAVTFGQG